MQCCAFEITGAVAMLPKSRVPWLCMQSMLCFTVKPDQQRTLYNCYHEEKIVRDCIYQLSRNSMDFSKGIICPPIIDRNQTYDGENN